MSPAYKQFKKQLAELGGLEIPHEQITFWDVKLSQQKRREILDSCGFDFIPAQSPWVSIKPEQRETIKRKVANMVRAFAPFAGLGVAANG